MLLIICALNTKKFDPTKTQHAGKLVDIDACLVFQDLIWYRAAFAYDGKLLEEEGKSGDDLADFLECCQGKSINIMYFQWVTALLLQMTIVYLVICVSRRETK